jgi:hypothetical protein
MHWPLSAAATSHLERAGDTIATLLGAPTSGKWRPRREDGRSPADKIGMKHRRKHKNTTKTGGLNREWTQPQKDSARIEPTPNRLNSEWTELRMGLNIE